MPHGTFIICADGHRDEVLGRGDVRVNFTHGQWITLRDVLHVSTISKGLVSANKLTRVGSRWCLREAKL